MLKVQVLTTGRPRDHLENGVSRHDFGECARQHNSYVPNTATELSSGAIPVPRRCPFESALVRFCPLRHQSFRRRKYVSKDGSYEEFTRISDGGPNGTRSNLQNSSPGFHCALIPGTQLTRLPMFALRGARNPANRFLEPRFQPIASSAPRRSGAPSARRRGKVTDREYHPGVDAE